MSTANINMFTLTHVTAAEIDCRRQILTSKVDPRAVRVIKHNLHQRQNIFFLYLCFFSIPVWFAFLIQCYYYAYILICDVVNKITVICHSNNTIPAECRLDIFMSVGYTVSLQNVGSMLRKRWLPVGYQLTRGTDPMLF